MTLRWEGVPHRRGRTKNDCFADGSNGRWLLRKASASLTCYVVRLNGKEIARFDTLTASKSYAERQDTMMLDANGNRSIFDDVDQ